MTYALWVAIALTNFLTCSFVNCNCFELDCQCQEHYDKVLAEAMTGYSIECVQLSSAPLPEIRPRLWWVGSRCPSFSASRWKSEIEHIQKASEAMAQQNLSPYFEASSDTPDAEITAPSWQRESKYHEMFASNMARMGKLLKDTEPLPHADRPSQKLKALQAGSPCTQATADIMSMVLDIEIRSASRVPGSAVLTKVADLSQTCTRARTSISGQWGTLTTSSKLFDFVSGKYLDVKHHLRLLGMDPSLVTLKAIRDSEPRLMCSWCFYDCFFGRRGLIP